MCILQRKTTDENAHRTLNSRAVSGVVQSADVRELATCLQERNRCSVEGTVKGLRAMAKTKKAGPDKQKERDGDSNRTSKIDYLHVIM